MGVTGESSYDSGSGTFNISASGTQIGGMSDSFHFTASDASGAFDVTVKITSFSAPGSDARAGLMVRDGTVANAPFVGAFVTPTGAINIVRRTALGTFAMGSSGQTVSFPVHLRLSRSGNVVRASYSRDGATWAALGSTELNLPSLVKVGLAANAKSTTDVAVLRADCPVVSAGTGGATLNGLTIHDVGTSNFGATASVAGNVHSVGAGGYILPGTTREALGYLARRTTDPAAISTYVQAPRAGSRPARAGLMFRDGLGDGGAMASLAVDAAGRVVFEHRAAPGAFTITRAFAETGRYLLLDRQGATVTAMVSSDGKTWRTLGSATVDLGEGPYAGLYAISASPTTAVHADFDGFDVVTQ